MSTIKNKLIFISFLVSIVFISTTEVKSGSYVYGGPKLFYYDVTQEDLNDKNNKLPSAIVQNNRCRYGR